jgi:DNA polymerase III gamma/tau subunit
MLLDTVLKISKKEGFKIERDAAELLALLGDGSFRDTLGTLQKVMSYSSDKALTVDEVEKITGAPRRSIVEGIVGHLADGNADQAIADVHSAALSGVNMSVLNELVVEMVRNILLCRVSPMAKKRLESELDKEAFKTIETLARDASRLNSRLLRSLLDMAQLERKTSIAELPLELIIIDSYSNQTSI